MVDCDERNGHGPDLRARIVQQAGRTIGAARVRSKTKESFACGGPYRSYLIAEGSAEIWNHRGVGDYAERQRRRQPARVVLGGKPRGRDCDDLRVAEVT